MMCIVWTISVSSLLLIVGATEEAVVSEAGNH